MKYFRFGTSLLIFTTFPFFPATAADFAVGDSKAPADTTAVRDSVRSAFIPSIGNFQTSGDSSSLHWTRFQWTDARFPGDLLEFTPGFFLRQLGEPGQPHQLIVDGLDWRRVAFFMDGLPLTDPVTGTVSLSDIPIEFIDHVEILRGPRAFLFGNNGTGAAINFVTLQFDSNRPITRIRFMQGPYEHLLTDGFYTQNIARGLNVMVGFLRQVTDGRYTNAKFDFWNIRSRIRYNLTDRLNIVVNDFYTRSFTGVNGGVLFDSSRAGGLDIFEGTQAIMRSTNSNQTNTRRDFSASVIGRFFADSSWTTQGRIRISTLDREFHDPDAAFPSTANEFSWKIIGLHARQNIDLGIASLVAGADLEQRTVSPSSDFGRTRKNYYAWYGKAELRLLDLITPSAFARGEKLEETEAFSYGLDARLTPLSALTFEGGYSRSYRFPTFQETNWPAYVSPSTGTLNLLEEHTVVQAGASINLATITVSATGSSRTVKNAIVHRLFQVGTENTAIEAVPEMKIRALSGSASVDLWKFTAKGNITFSEIAEQSALQLLNPKFVLTGEFSFRDQLLDSALDAHIGVRARYMSKQQGMKFLPAQLVHVENPGDPLGAFSTLDIFGVFRIGDALIQITWENVLDRRYFITPAYPMLDRNVKIGLNWVFLE